MKRRFGSSLGPPLEQYDDRASSADENLPPVLQLVRDGGELTTTAMRPVQSETSCSRREAVRVEALDYLRGLLAIGVMLYHYKTFSSVELPYPLEQIFQRIGLYGVCTFYVLSGVSLGIVYVRRQIDTAFLCEFSVKRFFRIAPLFWVATTLTIALRWLLRPEGGLYAGGIPPHPILQAIANYSLSFSWFRPDAYIAVGAWSIGNEIVFYSLFPGLVFLMRSSRKILTATLLITFAIGMIFAYGLLDRGEPLGDGDQWRTYINPCNHLFLFCGGIALAILRGRCGSHRLLLGMLLIAAAAFALWPTRGAGGPVLVTGCERILFSLFAFAFCYVAVEWRGGFGIFAGTLVWVGNISYAVYLLHPIAYEVIRVFNEAWLHVNGTLASCLFAIPGTVVCSMVSWQYLERPMMGVGRRLLRRRERLEAAGG